MKKSILLLTAFTGITAAAQGQSNKLFAITGDTKGNTNWNAVREINASDGIIKNTIYSPSAKMAVSLQPVFEKNTNPSLQQTEPTVGGVAASAFDAVNNRLYYTTMRGNELRYFDLNKQSTTVVFNDDANFNTGNKYTSEAAIITRMTFGLDGTGYALSNDGDHLVRFTTGKKPVITDLGKLIDGKANGNTSVHQQCTSWGGDMVGDAFGNLYLVTMRSFIYKINPQTLVADLVGQIKGLPADFTSNGAAVNEDGDLVVSSATYTESYFKVNINTLQVMGAVKGNDGVYNASDLASSNLLYQTNGASFAVAATEVLGNGQISIYPNPVISKTFKVKFDNAVSGDYSVQISDASGRLISQKNTYISGKGQVEKISLPIATSGFYLVKVLSKDKKVIYSDKISVQ